MSCFVSESLKGRISEEDLIKDTEDKTLESVSSVFVKAKFENFSHDFEFVSLERKKNFQKLVIEIPQSYLHLSKMLKSNVEFEVSAYDGAVTKIYKAESNYELIKQNRRNCYLLKIVIGEQAEERIWLE